MEPVPLEAEDVALLPPDAELVTYAKDQPEYRPLPVARLKGPEGRVISRWTFTDEERAAIARGEDLYLSQLTWPRPGRGPVPLQPILPTVGLQVYLVIEQDVPAQDESGDWP